MISKIYLDNNATTRIDDEVLKKYGIELKIEQEFVNWE